MNLLKFKLFSKKRDFILLRGFIALSTFIIYVIMSPVYTKVWLDEQNVLADSKNLREHVIFLSERNQVRSYQNKDSLNHSANYISDVFA